MLQNTKFLNKTFFVYFKKIRNQYTFKLLQGIKFKQDIIHYT